MPDNENTTPTDTVKANLAGCSFDVAAAKAISGKDIVAMVTDKTGTKLLAMSGQTGLSFNISGETTESATKDDVTEGWKTKLHGNKTWDASVDGLYSPDDEATRMVAAALANDEYVCLKVCERTRNENGTVTYAPLRIGLAVVTSDNFEAPSDDNATYSMDFEGSGKLWMRETATEEEIAAATFTV